MNCKGDYSVIVQLDSLFILDQFTVDKSAWDTKGAISGQGTVPGKTQVTCTFRFKFHLSILDSLGNELAV